MVIWLISVVRSIRLASFVIRKRRYKASHLAQYIFGVLKNEQEKKNDADAADDNDDDDDDNDDDKRKGKG